MDELITGENEIDDRFTDPLHAFISSENEIDDRFTGPWMDLYRVKMRYTILFL